MLFVEVKGGSLVFDGREWVHEVRARYGSEQGPEERELYRHLIERPNRKPFVNARTVSDRVKAGYTLNRQSRGVLGGRGRAVCQIEGCGKLSHAKGRCNSHYWAWKYKGGP